MAIEPVIGDGARPPTSPPAGPVPDVRLPAELLRSLTEVLAEGEAVSARVVQALGGDQYQLTVRGRTVIAESATPLAQDSVVRVQLVAGGVQPTLRLLDLPAAFDQALSSAAPARAQALGLPLTPASYAAITAFEEVGAPLDPARLRHAVEQSAPLPPAEAATRLRALALVARADLPATPALIALAGHSVTQGAERALPNPAAAVIALRQAAQPLLMPTTASAPAGTVALEPDLATTVTAPAVTSAQSPNADPRTPSTTQSPLSIALSAQTTAAATVVVSTTAGVTTAAATIRTPGTASPVDGDGAEPLPGQARPTVAQQMVGTAPPPLPAAYTTATAQSPTTLKPAQTDGRPLPAVAGNPSAPTAPPVPLSAGSATAVVSQAPSPVIIPRSAVPMPISPAVLLRDLLTEPLPDLATGGVEAAKRALSLAGVRSRPEAGEEPALANRTTTLAERVAALPLPHQSDPSHTIHPLTEPAMRLTRELAADAVFKPDDLADYDRVLALPITVHGQPVPARLAIAERRTTGGNATFVRVDTDLSALGEVSVRLSGVEGGSLAITLLASGSGGRALADGLPALVDALRELGIVAAVRVADPLVEDHGDAHA